MNLTRSVLPPRVRRDLRDGTIALVSLTVSTFVWTTVAIWAFAHVL